MDYSDIGNDRKTMLYALFGASLPILLTRFKTN